MKLSRKTLYLLNRQSRRSLKLSLPRLAHLKLIPQRLLHSRLSLLLRRSPQPRKRALKKRAQLNKKKNPRLKHPPLKLKSSPLPKLRRHPRMHLPRRRPHLRRLIHPKHPLKRKHRP
jgi:hypothetical protein